MKLLRKLCASWPDQRGFTLVELLTAMALGSIIMTLGAFSLRHYWLVQSVEQAQGEVKSQLRQLQQRAVSESNPLVFGARFTVGSSEWSIVRYDPVTSGTTADDVCTKEPAGDDMVLAARVLVTTATFRPPDQTTSIDESRCPGHSAASSYVWFYAKGTSSGGTPVAGNMNPAGRVEFTQVQADRSAALCVVGLTGRVYEREGGQGC